MRNGERFSRSPAVGIMTRNDEFARRQLRSLIMSRTARSSPEGLGARRRLAAIIDRLPQSPWPLGVKGLQKKADSTSVLVYAVARCRAAGPRTLVGI
jgi:hypothetical protein